MLDDLDPRSPIPLYEQIAARIRVAVAAQEYAAGDPLPSVRRLSSTLRVNPATVVQAYRDLEREGFVEMRGAERARQARELARGVLAEAARLGVSARELLDALHAEVGGDHG